MFALLKSSLGKFLILLKPLPAGEEQFQPETMLKVRNFDEGSSKNLTTPNCPRSCFSATFYCRMRTNSYKFLTNLLTLRYGLFTFHSSLIISQLCSSHAVCLHCGEAIVLFPVLTVVLLQRCKKLSQ